MMSDERFVCIDIGYGDDWYITDDGKRLSEMEIVDLLNEQQATINNQEQKIKILQQEIKDTQAILEMQSEKLKGWNDE